MQVAFPPVSQQGNVVARSEAVAAARQLAEATAALLSGNRHPSEREMAGIRAIALALAADFRGEDDSQAGRFRTLAATVTLLQQRDRGTAAIGESIVLATA
jgi:hypothetical protein